MLGTPCPTRAGADTPSGQPKRRRWLLIALAAILLLAAGMAAVSLLRLHRVQQHLEMGEKYLNELDYNSAVMEFTSAIEVDPRSRNAYLGRGDAYLGLNNYESAEDDFTVVIELDDKTIEGYVGRSRAHAGQGEQTEAEEDLQKAIANGLDETQAEKIRQENVTPAGPLTAEDVVWLMEPNYDYQQVIPLRGNSFSDIAGSYADGQQSINETFFEMSFPGYSNLPQYYLVRLGDGSWRFYYMPTHTDSGNIAMDQDSSQEMVADVFRYDASGIADFNAVVTGAVDRAPYVLDAAYPSPWYVFSSHERGSGWMSIYYDTYTQQGLAVGMFYGVYTTPVSKAGLHKPYPASQFSSATLGLDVNRSLDLEIGEDSDANRFVEAINASQESRKAYVDTKGQLITDFLYDEAEDFSEGIAACCRDGKWGYIDENGVEITDFVYDGIWPYQGEYDPDLGESGGNVTEYSAYPCTSDTMVVYRDGQVGLLYRDGSLLIDYGEFEDMAPAYNNELWAKKDGLWGLIDLADAKRQTRRSSELTVVAKTEIPDPAFVPYEQEEHPETEPIDFPATVSQIYDFYQQVDPYQDVLAPVVMYTSPDGGKEITTIPAGEVVQVIGQKKDNSSWVCVSWYIMETQRTYFSNTYFDQEYVSERYYGWVPVQNLTPDSGQ